MITEQIERDVITAEVNDFCEVEVWSRKRRVKLTPADAMKLAGELTKAAAEAEAAAAELSHPVEPSGFDAATIWRSPDCAAGKHRACDETALNGWLDEIEACACECHKEVTGE